MIGLEYGSPTIQSFLDRWGVDYETSGDEIIAACPWKQHRTGRMKLYVNSKTGLWQCKACSGKKGNIFHLISLMEDITFHDAVDFLQRQYDGDIDYEAFGEYIENILKEEEAKPLFRKTMKELYSDTKRFLNNECLSIEQSIQHWQLLSVDSTAVRQFKLRYAPNSRYPFIMPIYNNDKPAFYISRAMPHNTRGYRYQYQKGFPKGNMLYGFDPDHPVGTLVLCEGPLDAIAIAYTLRRFSKKFRDYGVGAVLGSSISHQQRNIIISSCDDIVTFFDNDDAGIGLTQSCKYMFRNMMVRSVKYGDDEGGKDPRDLWYRVRAERILEASLQIGD